MNGFWRRHGRSKDTDPALRGSGAPSDGPGGAIADELGSSSGSTSGSQLGNLFQVGTMAGRVSRLLALGATGATLIAATPNYLPDKGSGTGPAGDQYAEQVTLCGRLGADSSEAQTLRLPASEAESLLREDSSATQGPC